MSTIQVKAVWEQTLVNVFRDDGGDLEDHDAIQAALDARPGLEALACVGCRRINYDEVVVVFEDLRPVE